MTRTQDNYDRTLQPLRRSVHSRALPVAADPRRHDSPTGPRLRRAAGCGSSARARLRLVCPPPVTRARGCRGLHAADALFIGLGCVGGLALPRVWIHAGTASGGLILAGGVLSI